MRDQTITFGLWLRRRRRALDLTQQELADQIPCSVVTIRKFESNERRPSKQLAALLGKCLHVAKREAAAFVAFARCEPGAEKYLSPMSAPPTSATPPQDSTHADAALWVENEN